MSFLFLISFHIIANVLALALNVTLGQLLYRNARFLKRLPFYPSSFKSVLDQNLQLTEASNRNINSGLSFNFHWKCSVRGKRRLVLNVLMTGSKVNG